MTTQKLKETNIVASTMVKDTEFEFKFSKLERFSEHLRFPLKLQKDHAIGIKIISQYYRQN